MSDTESMERIKQLEHENEKLHSELRKLKRKPEGKIGYILLLIGLSLLALAIIYSHNVSAYIGIALTFWGALILFIRPTHFIRKEILDSTNIEPLKSTHKLLDELGYEGTPTHISPGTLRGLRTATLYIPKTNEIPMPTDEQLSQEQIIMNDPPAIKLTPPGLGLHSMIEKELKTNFSMVDLNYLQMNLEKALVEGLEIAEALEMEVTDTSIKIEIRGNIFDEILKQLYEEHHDPNIGDPLSSAIACILARSTREPIIIEQIEREPDTNSTRITMKIGH